MSAQERSESPRQSRRRYRSTSPQPRRLSRRVYWFQEEGQWDSQQRVWVPHRPLPQLFEMPGVLNIHERPDALLYTQSAQFRDIIRRWEQERWPRLSRAMRQLYVEKRRTSLRRFHAALWPLLRPIRGYTRADMRRRFGVDDELRLDHYDNVLARNAQRFSLCSWDVDHILAYSRGGLSELGNLRIIASRANQAVKRSRLEPLIKREEMQVGLSLQDLLQLEEQLGEQPEQLYTVLTQSQRRIRDELERHADEWLADDTRAELACDQCSEAEAQFVCSRCRQAQYCSHECAARAHAEWHERHCRALEM